MQDIHRIDISLTLNNFKCQWTSINSLRTLIKREDEGKEQVRDSDEEKNKQNSSNCIVSM